MQKTTLVKWLAPLALIALMGGCRPVQAPAAGTAEATATTPAAAAEEPAAPVPLGDPTKLIIATTTSTQDSGLLDAILPDFEAQFRADTDVVAVGTGQALKLGEDCNADVVLVHARAREDEFTNNGFGARREDVMFNDFIIVGPAADPAGVQGMTDAAAALAQIAAAQAPFISRGDESGTHTKELAVWKVGGSEPSGDWYISAGQGMGAVLNMANEQQAYTLSDRATYLARTKEGLELDILVEGDPVLFNPYGVITVNPQACPNVNAELGSQVVEWIISIPTQEKIGQYGAAEFGQPLFTPDSMAWKNQ
jgi:tungstate transport system substrate-binding protein